MSLTVGYTRASSTSFHPSTASSHASSLGCYKRYFFNISTQRRRYSRSLGTSLLQECRGGSNDYPPPPRGRYDIERREGGDYDYGPERHSGYGYDPYYSDEKEQPRRQRRRREEEEEYSLNGEPPYARRQRWSDEGSATTGSSRRVEKNVGVSLLMDAAGNRRVGILLASSGAVFTLLGISLFFNKTLLRMGNLLFISGVPLILGPSRTVGYFFQPNKFRATGCLLFGIFLVLAGRPILGMALEIFGIMNLFGNLFPLLMVMLRQVPFLGELLPSSSSNNGGGKRGRERREYYKDAPYQYDNDRRNHQDGVEQYY